MPKELMKMDQLAVSDYREMIKAIASDIGKEVAHHIEIMYPDAVKATTPNMLVSVRGCVVNEIMGAIGVNDGRAPQWLKHREEFRRHIKAAYKKIRKQSKPLTGGE